MGTTNVLQDIEEMNKVFESVAKTEEKKEEVKPPEEEVKEEEKKEEEKVEEPIKEEEKKEEVKAPEEKKEEPPPKEPQPDERDKTITDLRAELAALKAEKIVKPKEEAKPEPKLEEPKIEDQDFVGELDLDEVTRDSKEFNKLLNNLYKKARTDSEQALISKLSTVVSSQMEMQRVAERAGEDFYKANEDLKGFPKVVKVVFDELAPQNPNRTLDEVMKEVAKEARKRLGLQEPKVKEVKEEPKKEEVKKDPPPKLPSKGSSAGRIKESSGEPESLQKELEEMSKAVR